MKSGLSKPVLLIAAAALAVGGVAAVQGTAGASTSAGTGSTTTPIKHVIVIIGENHSFDNVFATYTPPRHQQIRNLLSEGIVNADGTPGPNFARAAQLTASDTAQYTLSPRITGQYKTLPQPNTTYVATSCDGQPQDIPDARFPATLPNGPFQITRYVPYADSHAGCPLTGAFVGDPRHRFYQMWQQTAVHQGRLNTWVANTAGDDNGANPPATIFQGGLSMGFYNMAQGDAPFLQQLAARNAISDNYHQAAQGGTGANHIALGTGWAASFQDASGNPVAPPPGEIENPNPSAGTNNHYTQDGYGSSAVKGNGGSYSQCADPQAPGVSAIDAYFGTLPYKPLNACQPGRYYLLNNYNPGYNVDGTLNTSTYTVPPQKTGYVTIGDALSARSISWKYYGEGFVNGTVQPQYCGICDPMQYSASIMTNPALRANTQHGLSDFLADARSGSLPAVSFLKPGDDDSHPGYSRIPMIVVSPWARHGAVDHTYNDHVSVLKFIEANWGLPPLTSYSEDNLPNPAPQVYIPRNRPAIGDLMTLFNFDR